MMNLQDIRYFHEYNRWANHLILDAVEAISVEEQMRERGVSHSSLHGTLVHLLFAEWVWLNRWKGNSPAVALKAEDFPDLASIRQYWHQLEAEYDDFLSNLTEETLQANLTYQDIAGNQHSNPLVLLMQHVVNHATLHRGQVMAMIRQLGIKPPATDFLFFFRR